MSLPFYQSWAGHASKYFEDNYEYKSRFELFNNEQFKNLFTNAPGVILVISHVENKYEFISENIKNLVGFTSEDFYKGHVPFGMSLVYPEHAKIFMEFIFPKIFDTLEEHKLSGDMKKLRITYNFKMRRKDGGYSWMQQDMSILESDEKGNPVISMYFMQEVTTLKKDEQMDFAISFLGVDGYYKPSLIINYPSNQRLELSNREVEILSLLSHGKSSKEIALDLGISYFTVQTHRKNMLAKTGARNITELLKLAILKGITPRFF